MGTTGPRSEGGNLASRFEVLRRRIADALWPDDDATILLPTAGGTSGPGPLLAWLAREGEPVFRATLLAEALALLDEPDRRIIESRLAGEPHEAIARALEVRPEAITMRLALAVDRLADRLAWLVGLARGGVSPPERAALGKARFQGQSPQEIAYHLRLPREVVERWIHLADPTPWSE